MAYQIKEFELCHSPDNINSWFHDNPEIKVISSYASGHRVGIIYETTPGSAHESKHQKDHGADTEEANWIFRDPPNAYIDGYDWGKIEKALGFRLFYWQKMYIQTGEFRSHSLPLSMTSYPSPRFGKTTAEILRNLLSPNQDSDPVVLVETVSNRYFIDMYQKLYTKLKSAGIPCRDFTIKKVGRTQNGRWYP